MWREGKESSEWERRFFEERGAETRRMGKWEGEEEGVWEEIERKEKEMQKVKR